MLNKPAIATLNHLLTQSGWALQRLERFSGKTVHISVAPFSFGCTVGENGALLSAASGASADAELVIAPSLLPRLALGDEAAYGEIGRAGDSALIEEVIFLSRNLRWDAAEDLSRFTGDIAAERIGQFARAQHKMVRDAAGNLAEAVAEYWTEERPVLAKAGRIADFAQKVGTLRDEVEKLEQRIKRLGNR